MSENIAATLRNLVYNGADEATMHKAMLEAADVLESIAADLDTLREFTKELAKRNEELHKEKLAAVLHVPAGSAWRMSRSRNIMRKCCVGTYLTAILNAFMPF